MIHFFPTISDDASNSPFAQELRATGVAHRLHSERVALRYRRRVWLLLLGWPRLLAFALRSAWKSLVRSTPKPDTVVLGSDIEVLVFGAARALLGRRGLRIVLLCFIRTQRRSRLLNALRHAYFRLVFACADAVICHSVAERADYSRVFAGSRARFAYMPYGLHVAGRDAALAEPAAAGSAGNPRVVVAAGRSERDYATLFDAMRGVDAELHVVCDSDHALAGLDPPPNARVLRRCYGADYLRELARASLVVVPLAVNDVSAGQMVMIQAMAFAKPVVVTRTATIEEYVTDGLEAALVPCRDPVALRRTIERLLGDAAEAGRIGRAGLHAYESRFNMRSYVRNLVAVAEGAASPP